MADDTKKDVDASNEGAVPAPEPVIIEEHEVAKKQPLPPEAEAAAPMHFIPPIISTPEAAVIAAPETQPAMLPTRHASAEVPEAPPAVITMPTSAAEVPPSHPHLEPVQDLKISLPPLPDFQARKTAAQKAATLTTPLTTQQIAEVAPKAASSPDTVTVVKTMPHSPEAAQQREKEVPVIDAMATSEIPAEKIPLAVMPAEPTHAAAKPIPAHSDEPPIHVPPKDDVRFTPAHASSTSTPSAPQGPFAGDISKILKDIKLPERRDLKGSADLKKPTTEVPPVQVHSDTPEPKILEETVVKNEIAASPSAPPAQVPSSPVQETPAAKMSAESEKTRGVMTMRNTAVSPLRTLKVDLQHVITSRGISLVRAVALEQDKKKETKHLTAVEIASHRARSRRIFAVLFSAATLFLLGAAALAGVYTIQSERSATVSVGDDNSILFAEQTVAFPLDNQTPEDIKRVLAQARGGNNAALGSITRIVPTITENGIGQRPVTTSEFFKALDLHAPDGLIRALGDSFFLGIHTVDKNAPVFVFTVTSYDHAFAGMLAWESTMNADLAPFFTLVPALATGDNGLPAARPFRDMVMRNYDVRALKDDSGTIELYYSFPTPNLLVIAESPYSFTEVLSRLQTERKL